MTPASVDCLAPPYSCQSLRPSPRERCTSYSLEGEGINMANTVVCMTQDRAQAEQIVTALRDGNFSNAGISVVLPDVAPSQALQPVEDNKSAEGAAIGAGTGGVIGGVLGWLVGIGALT